jgi:hypothetical protein
MEIGAFSKWGRRRRLIKVREELKKMSGAVLKAQRDTGSVLHRAPTSAIQS